MYKTLGTISLILVIIITAPYWLRTLNSWTVKTKDKRFFSLLKFLRKHLRMTDEYHGEAFFVVKNGLRYATPMFVVLVFVELSDVVRPEELQELAGKLRRSAFFTG